MTYLRINCTLTWAFLACFAALFSGSPAGAQDVVINEIMYHPASHEAREEYIELFNRGTTNVNLTGWALKGVVKSPIEGQKGNAEYVAWLRR